MNILALDLGTRTGWASFVNESRESGVQVFDVRRGESPGMRYFRFNSWLCEFVKSQLNLVMYEQFHQRGGAATEVAAGFATRVQEFCARSRIEHCVVHSMTLKKFATGSGKAQKSDMIRLAAAKFKPGLTSDDEADALWVLEYAKSQFMRGKS